jgi:hypothetical protein
MKMTNRIPLTVLRAAFAVLGSKAIPEVTP